MLKNYWNLFIKKSNDEKIKKPLGKVKVSLLSILTGLIFGLIIVWAIGGEPIRFLGALVTSGFKNNIAINQLLIFTSVFILSGLANAFAFKTGLFNIGVSGQMLAGGGLSLYLSITIFDNMNKMVAIPLLIIIAMATSGLIGLLVGWLKTKFNVHEVVSTILLNWIIFYLIKWLFILPGTPKNSSGDSLKSLHTFTSGSVSEGGWPIAILISISVLVIVAVLLKITVFGKKLKITGLSTDGAQYAGINVKRSIILSMVISSVIAGVLGFVFYFGKQGFMPAFQTTALPTIGFDGIALSLLAFNNPIGILPISFMYAMFKVSATFIEPGILPPNISNQTISLIFSIIIYAAAVSVLFYKFRPVSFIIKMIRISKDNRLITMKLKFKENLLKRKEEYNELENTIKEKIDVLSIKIKSLDKDSKNLEVLKNELMDLNEQLKIEQKKLKVLRKENNSILSEKHYELLNNEIILNYKTSLSYVKESIKDKTKNEIAFAKMALQATINKIISDKNKIIDLKRQKKDASSKDEKQIIQTEINKLKEIIANKKQITKEKLLEAKVATKDQIKKIKEKNSIKEKELILKFKELEEKMNLKESLKDKKMSEKVQIKEEFISLINTEVLKGVI